jgi:hypothetical protein
MDVYLTSFLPEGGEREREREREREDVERCQAQILNSQYLYRKKSL